jgi:hypothetical protein
MKRTGPWNELKKLWRKSRKLGEDIVDNPLGKEGNHGLDRRREEKTLKR